MPPGGGVSTLAQPPYGPSGTWYPSAVHQAAAIEPLIAAQWEQGREQSRYAQTVFWTRMAEDGLLDPGLDLQWLIDTSTILAAAETYLLITRLMGWDLDAYEGWLAATGARLARAADGHW